MLCKSCGVEVNVESTFCHKCGKPIESADGQLSPQSVPDSPQVTGSPAPESGSEAFFDRLSGGNQDRTDDPEEQLWKGGYSPKAMIGWWIMSGLVTLLLIVLGVMLSAGGKILVGIVIIDLLMFLALGMLLVYRKLNVHYQLTSQRFIHRIGILRRITDRIEVIDMDDISFEQGLIERMLSVGKIRITSSDRTHPEIVLLGIDNVQEVALLLDAARRKERVRRGVHIEAI